MGFTIGYKRLFAVRIMHGYFLNQGEKAFDVLPEPDQIRTELSYQVSDFLRVIPSAGTAEIMKGRGMIFRMDATGFFVGVKIDQAAKELGLFKPFISMDEELKLRFYLKLKDPYFFNYSSLSLKKASNQVYHFSNEVDNASTGQAQLSRPLPVYDPAIKHEAGSLIVDNQANPTTLFEALRDTGNAAFNATDWEEQLLGDEYADPPQNYAKGDVVRLGNSLYTALQDPSLAPPDASQWAETPISHQYVGKKDVITLVPAVFSVSLPDGTNSAKTAVYRIGESEPFHVSDLVKGEDFKTHSIDLRSLNAGNYRLEVVSSSGTVLNSSISGNIYLDQELFESGGLGVVEITHKPGVDQGAYQLLAADQQLLSPEFYLRFKNRSTFWRYIFNHEQSVTDGQLGEFVRDGDASEKKNFKTQSPKPLTLALEPLKKFNTEILLPNPGVNLVKLDHTDGHIYSEIYIYS